MRRLSCGLAVLALGTAVATAAEPASRGWFTDYAKAEAEARRQLVPLVIHFSAEWCGPCKQMEADVLSRPEMLSELAARAVGVKVDSDQRPDLVTRFGITALPSDVIVTPDTGKVLARTTGIQDRKSYIGRIASYGAKYEEFRVARVAAAAQKAAAAKALASKANPDASADSKAETEAVAEVPAEDGKPSPLGLAGFSPVSLTKDQKWVAGREEFVHVFEGIEYRMASVEEWETFKANPERYAPRYLGCDAMILATTERAVSGNIRYGAFWRGGLYLFYSEQNRGNFIKDPQKYTQISQAIQVNEIELLTSR